MVSMVLWSVEHTLAIEAELSCYRCGMATDENSYGLYEEIIGFLAIPIPAALSRLWFTISITSMSLGSSFPRAPFVS